ncbi:MAG: 5-amino-6-(D-ribitylamino)uracil--L-tyrosine 4-hydroxyphenyl transferase CofH [Actinobacteria bacterium]|nr:5-amino-6-(D-ribitylamino)uracil--L-tyrosine 4-hydroxyphenyl transferase CofH [Actinomycetota bacterium]
MSRLAHDDNALLAASIETLAVEARAIRDEAFGTRVTWSPKVFIPLTQLCRDKCGYCTFAQPPARLDAPYLEMDDVLAIARAGADAGCHEALFTLGERPELRYPQAASWLRDHGHATTVEYLISACAAVLDETGLLPHANAGALSADELRALREVSASQGMMIESLDEHLDAHRGSPDKTPLRRLATLEDAGRLGIPFTTGLLVGIGDTRAMRLAALRAIVASHERHGHVQEVIIQNFVPKPGTTMHLASACSADELAWTLAVARIILPTDVHLQAPPNLSEDFGALLRHGIDDWGGVSPVTPDHVNPEMPWPHLDRLREVTEAHGHTLAPRLTVYPAWARQPDRWLDEALRFPVLRRSDADSLARDDHWHAGGDEDPPQLLATEPTTFRVGAVAGGAVAGGAVAGGTVAEVLAGVMAGEEVGIDEIVTLFSARGPEVRAVADVADELRRQAVGDTVTWVSNRNINYTNVCTFKCRFCAFSKGPLSLNLRGAPYLLTLDDIRERVVEAAEMGATEVCLQGGIHPDFDGDYYLHVTEAVHDAAPNIHIHGFTALEVTEGAKRSGEALDVYLRRLMAAGLRTLPGTAAEILDDEIRAVLCSDKVNTEEWLYAHRTAHQVGLRSNVTIMFGSIEQPLHWARHLVRTRDLQKETGGFTEFVPLPFVHMAAPMYLQGKARPGPTFREALLMHAIGRIAYRGWIDNIQVSWVKMGVTGSRQALRAGVNDLGGTLINENISRAAGASHGQAMTEHGFADVVEQLGRPLSQRTTLYKSVTQASTPTDLPAPQPA